MWISKKQFQKHSLVFGVLLVIGIGIPAISPIQAGDGVGDYIAGIIAFVLLKTVSFFGQFLTVLTGLLIQVAKYNSFGSETFVINAWVVVRDFANIFFIIALLLIAVATILRIEVYSAKRLLFKLILMAVLINFSRSVAIFIINIAQVIMLFFIRAFESVQGLLLTNILLLNEYLTLVEDQDQLANFDLSGLIGNILLAGIFIAIGTFVIGTIILLLVFRIIFLWLLIILSPLAFLLHAVPGGTKYASQWWASFSKNVISGPVMAFFLWLAYFAVSSSGDGQSIAQQFFKPEDDGALLITANASSISSPDNLLSFIVGIGLLIGGLVITAQIGGAGASMASSAVSRIQRTGAGALRGGRNLALGAARGVARPVGYAADAARMNLGSRARTNFPTLAPKIAGVAAGIFTKAGRERAGSRMQAGIYSRVGGESGGRKAENITARARVARRKELQGKGSLEGHANLRAGFDSAMQQNNMQEAMIYTNEMIDKEVGGVEGNIAKFADKFEKQDKNGRSVHELEQKQSKKNKTYVPTYKEVDDEHGQGTERYKKRKPEEMKEEMKNKVEKLEPKVYSGMLVKLQEDTTKRERIDIDKVDPGKDEDTLTPLLNRINAIRPDNEKLGSFGTTNIRAFTGAITSAIAQINGSAWSKKAKEEAIEPLQQKYTQAYDYHKLNNPKDYSAGVTPPIKAPEVQIGGRSRSLDETRKTREESHTRATDRIAKIQTSIADARMPESVVPIATNTTQIELVIQDLRSTKNSLIDDGKIKKDEHSEAFDSAEKELENLRAMETGGTVEGVTNQLEFIQEKLKEIEQIHISGDSGGGDAADQDSAGKSGNEEESR